MSYIWGESPKGHLLSVNLLATPKPDYREVAGIGVPKWIADKVSGWGDYYQFIALKSVLKHVNVNIKMYKSDKIKMYNYSKLT